MNGGVVAAIVTAVGAVVISMISALQAQRSQREKSQTDRLTMAQAETDRIIAHLKAENVLLWERNATLQQEIDMLRKQMRVIEGNM